MSDNWVVLKIQPKNSEEVCKNCKGEGILDKYSTWEEVCKVCKGEGFITSGVFYKLLRGFSGSYVYGSSWAMNSGIESVELLGDLYVFQGFSGSSYEVHKDRYGVRMNIAQVIAELEDKYPDVVKVMPDCDWNLFKFKGSTNESKSV